MTYSSTYMAGHGMPIDHPVAEEMASTPKCSSAERVTMECDPREELRRQKTASIMMKHESMCI